MRPSAAARIASCSHAGRRSPAANGPPARPDQLAEGALPQRCAGQLGREAAAVEVAQGAVADLDCTIVEERHVEVPGRDDVERGPLAGRADDGDAHTIVAAGGEADLRGKKRLAAA